MSTMMTPRSRRVIPALQVGPLRAEYALTKSHTTGEWVAVGTIHSVPPPACVIVGQGDSASEAVDDLRRQLEQQVLRARLKQSESLWS